MNSKILSIDIGGTHTRLALFAKPANKPLTLTFLTKYPSKHFPTFEELWTRFTQDFPKEAQGIEKGCIAAAGVIQDGICHTTNLPWVLQEKTLQQTLNIPHLHLQNDLQAAAYGLLALPKEAFISLHQGKGVKPQGNMALIGAGTGLGEAALFWGNDKYKAFSTEGGHADFAPKTALECELLLYLEKKFGRVSIEHVVSGPGLWHIYQFLKEEKKEETRIDPPKEEQEKGAFVTESALLYNDPLCQKALFLFLQAYAREAGNMALRTLAFGGVYLGGGIAPKLLPLLQEQSFLDAYLEKGVMQHLVESIPLFVVQDDRAPLFGNAWYLATCN